MIKEQERVIEECTPQEVEEILKNHKNEIPVIIRLLVLQESFFEAVESFQNNKISREIFLKKIHELDSAILPQCRLLLTKYYGSMTGKLKSCLNPIFNYSKNIFQNGKQANGGGLLIATDQKEKINLTFTHEYTVVRKPCIALFHLLSQGYVGSVVNKAEQNSAGLQGLRGESDLITKNELGYNENMADENFLSFLHNICTTLEVQQILSEVIRFRNLALKEALTAFKNYKRIIEKTDFVDRGNLSTDELPMGISGRGWQLKPFKTIEGYYIAYFMSMFSRDHTRFEELANFARPHLNVPNEEISNLAQLGIAKSNVDRSLDKYVKLVELFLKIKEKMTAVTALLQAYEELRNDPILALPAKLFPAKFFNFIIDIEHAHKDLNSQSTIAGKMKALESSIKITEAFIREFQENTELYVKNYRRLKKTIRKLALKCPSSQLYRERAYLNEDSLSTFSLDYVLKKSKPTQQEVDLIREFDRRTGSATTPEPVAPQQEAEKIATPREESFQPSKPKSTSKKKYKKQIKKKNPSPVSSSSTTLAAAASSSTPEVVQKKERRKNNPQNIILIDKKIAKQIHDEKNGMIIHIFRLKDNDATAGKTVNYDDRMQLWFHNPQAALAEKGYADSDIRRANSEAFHCFAKEVDKYALKWGFKRKLHNKFNKEITEILVPGLIDKTGIRYEGLFVYAIDNKNLCYHRFFHECNWRNKLADEWKITIDE